MSYPLGELITSVMATNNWALRKVVQQAEAAGHQDLKKSNLSRMIKQPPTVLVPSTMYALAAGLRLPPRVVVDAALRSLGVEQGGAPVRTPEQAVTEDPLLSERDKATLLALLSTLRHAPEVRRRAK